MNCSVCQRSRAMNIGQLHNSGDPVRVWHCDHCGTIHFADDSSAWIPKLAQHAYPQGAGETRTGEAGAVVELAAGDLIAESQWLLDAGYRVAAIATARAAVERALRKLAQAAAPQLKPQCGIPAVAFVMLRRGQLHPIDKQRIDCFCARCGTVIHGGNCSTRRAALLVMEAESLRAVLLAAIAKNATCQGPVDAFAEVHHG